MTAAEAAGALVGAAPEALFVSSLGTATSALREATDDGPHLFLGGAMGSALAVAIGVAERRPDRRVVALLGDGELLMGAGSLWALAASETPRLTAAVLCDGRYSITGGQPLGVPAAFSSVASALGLRSAVAATAAVIVAELEAESPPALLEIRLDDDTRPGPSPFVDPPVVRWRFEQAATVA